MFVSAVYRKASELPSNTSAHLSTTRQRWHSRTLEAFAHAVDGEIQIFDTWCASKEEEICRAHGGIGSALTVSLLNLEKSLGDAFGASFSVVLDVLRTVMDQISRTSSPSFRLLHACIPPAAVTALLLDTLLQAAQESLSMMDVTTANMLIRVFAMTAEPVWSMVCRWLTHGMPICDPATMRSECRNSMLDDEFFIDDNEVLLLDPDFWSDGYVLREGTTERTKTKMSEEGHDGPKTVPTFLAHVAVDVLSSGKATGLLRALGVPPAPDISGPNRSFSDLLASRTTHLNPQHGKVTNAASLSTDTLSRVVYDELLPHCRATGVQLTSVLVDDCDLWRHLSAIEDLYLMRRGDSMSHFTDLLFAKVYSLRLSLLVYLTYFKTDG
jgi:gamma-tubulin complex component 5